MTEPQHALPHPVASRRVERFAVVAFAVAMLAIFGVAATLIELGSVRSYARKQHDAKVGVAQALATANSSLTKNGLAPVATPTAVGPAPTVTVTVSGKTGPQGAIGPGPSQAQIQLALASYCAAHSQCGTKPTAAQVAEAVATYCTTDGRCRGPAGANATGSPGPPGPAGPAGQNATSDQVAAAVATYCGSHNQCAGPPGPAGANGQDGEPPVSWTYTDTFGFEHTCSRTSPFDRDAPTYTCD